MESTTTGSRTTIVSRSGAKGLSMRAAALVLVGAVVLVGVGGFFVLNAVGHTSTSTSSTHSCTKNAESYCENSAADDAIAAAVAIAPTAR